ncbi:MAG: hypothetical protein LBW85_08590 [Deltaproteobacteria bacterium]|nr:hypothetical protein [Deltaproteobacteria bacterium]
MSRCAGPRPHQRRLRIGCGRAARIIDDMERGGLTGPQDGARPRAIF